MSKTIKDPVALARAALKAGQKALPPYSHAKSPHKYTQAQLFAMLVLREFLRVDYRKLVAYLEQWSDLREALDLKRVPHYSTLCYAADRLLKKGAPGVSLMQRLLSHTRKT
ncbi:MAG: hypothetical protein CMJ84_11740 [Planctomycetes bacterium]|jgi:hypothetical protein|nr:hypothetical protein [Planctomycetota bacterium]